MQQQVRAYFLEVLVNICMKKVVHNYVPPSVELRMAISGPPVLKEIDPCIVERTLAYRSPDRTLCLQT